MPYITYIKREQLDTHINALVEALKRNRGVTNVEIDDGEVNYVITRLLRLVYHDVSYRIIERVVGILECVKLEFYRRIAASYEESKRSQNGDVY